MLAPVTHLLPLANIRRERVLPVSGRVLVRAGQKVGATDIIAEARVSSEHLILEVSRGLGVPPDRADKLVTRKVGDDVTEGDMLAGPVGVFSRTIRAPQPGRIAAIGGGQVLIELVTHPYELRAGLSGAVSELIPDRGAVIETYGVLVQGAWGNNRIEGGLLTVLARNPGDEFLANRLDVSMRGAIVLGGICTQADAIQAAVEIPLRALILSSISQDLIPLVSQAHIPVMVLNGIGKIPMDETTYKILSTNEKREVCINSVPWNRYARTRPEIVIPLPSTGQLTPPREVDIYAPGQVVRVLQAPNKGQIATIVTLRPGLTAFPSGVRASSAMIQMENGDKATVALANLEVIE